MESAFGPSAAFDLNSIEKIIKEFTGMFSVSWPEELQSFLTVQLRTAKGSQRDTIIAFSKWLEDNRKYSDLYRKNYRYRLEV